MQQFDKLWNFDAQFNGNGNADSWFENFVKSHRKKVKWIYFWRDFYIWNQCLLFGLWLLQFWRLDWTGLERPLAWLNIDRFCPKGQLILKANFKAFIWTKNQRKYFCVSALASKNPKKVIEIKDKSAKRLI